MGKTKGLILALLLATAGAANADDVLPPLPAQPPPPTCAFWNGATRVMTHIERGSAVYYLELELDMVGGVARLADHRSDSSNDKTMKLFAEDQRRVLTGLYGVCPTPRQLKAVCAPGGCLRLTVDGSNGTVQVFDAATATAVQRILSTMFPELRL